MWPNCSKSNFVSCLLTRVSTVCVYYSHDLSYPIKGWMEKIKLDRLILEAIAVEWMGDSPHGGGMMQTFNSSR